ncbi:ABC transporter substrate-binding protein [Fictibacillus sp. S7]|uniref:ABC transporter substrate-binding protein n=1 Tax=Fictibacillus sp. S7 TaxID=2212476 RepID=UPI0010117081|nr:ABC transporter substrate-binding protein [Fictibacillus sp. S7]RXZ01699.1 peptide ABC transporter substrate-binding protein [Fictibacillus sp. S7]
MKKKMSILMIAVMIVTLLSACVKNSNAKPSGGEGSDSHSEAASGKDVLTIATTAEQGTIDPAVTMDNSAWKLTYPAYERLVEYDGGSTKVKPGLAKEWKVSKDGKTWTFNLNEGHKFADGTAVDADAVKKSFERLKKIGKGPSEVFSVISNIKAENPTTVVFTLKENFPPFISTLAANYGSIVNPKVMDHEENGDMGQNYLATATMGSGPYKLAKWKKGEYVRLDQNKYASKKPSFKKVYFKIVADPSAQRLQLEKGEIDIAEGIPVDQINAVKKIENAKLLQEPSLLVEYVYVNSTKGNEALKNKKVRQALSYAVDYDKLIDAVQQGYGTQMRGPIPKGLWGHDDQAKQYTYDKDKAKALLKEAGVSNLSLDLLYSDNKTWWETEALTIQSNLKDIGVKVNLKKVAYATSREMMDKGEFDLALGMWSPDFGDPYAFMNYWYDSKNFGLAGNRAFYKNDAVDQKLRKAATLNDAKQREKLYQEAQDTVIDDAPYILLYQKDFLMPMSKDVKGFVYNPMLESMYNLADMSK